MLHAGKSISAVMHSLLITIINTLLNQ